MADETWHVVHWGLNEDEGVYVMVLGVPIIKPVLVTDPEGNPLLNADGEPVARLTLLGFEREQTILFAADEPKYTMHAGRKLTDEKILERHMKAVAAAFAQTVEVEPPDVPEQEVPADADRPAT